MLAQLQLAFFLFLFTSLSYLSKTEQKNWQVATVVWTTSLEKSQMVVGRMEVSSLSHASAHRNDVPQ